LVKSEADTFFELQTQTAWGGVLARFRDWIDPQDGWLTLDVGCGPGLLPALLTQRGCRACGVDLDPEMFRPAPLHPQVACADALRLPFPTGAFDCITASNLLFLLPQPAVALREMACLLRPGGQIATINPSERLTIAAAAELAEARGLQGAAHATLLGWAARAEAHFHWDEAETARLFEETGLAFVETITSMGPGFARFARGMRSSAILPGANER